MKEPEEALEEVLEALAARDPARVRRILRGHNRAQLFDLAAVAEELRAAIVRTPPAHTQGRHLALIVEIAERVREVETAGDKETGSRPIGPVIPGPRR